MTTTARLTFRVRPDTEHRLRAAAAATDQSLADFVISSAEARAEEVLASRTPIPAGYFNQLIAALDEPATPNDALHMLARRPRRMKQAQP